MSQFHSHHIINFLCEIQLNVIPFEVVAFRDASSTALMLATAAAALGNSRTKNGGGFKWHQVCIKSAKISQLTAQLLQVGRQN
jgi:hypothetical protein